MRRGIVLAALVALVPAGVHAEPLAAPVSGRTAQLGVEVGADPSLALRLWSVGRVARWPRWGEIHVGGAFGFPVATVRDGRTFDVSAGARHLVRPWRSLGVASRLRLESVSARNPRFDLVGLRLGLDVAPGWYAPRWSVACVFGYAPTVATHVHHREASRRAFEDRYPDGSTGEGPKDGWYRAPAHEVRVGVEAGGLIATRLSLLGAAGFQSPVGGLGLVSFPDVGRLPFFMTLGVGVALGPFRG